MTAAPSMAEVLAEVLAKHEDFGLYSEFGGDTHYVCSCDRMKRPGSHRTHLAQALAAAGFGHVASVEREGTHRYLSTYCHHGQHDACRLACKVCESPCVCECHALDGEATHMSDPWTLALAALGINPDTPPRPLTPRDLAADLIDPEPELWSPASDQECADAADRAVGGWGPW